MISEEYHARRLQQVRQFMLKQSEVLCPKSLFEKITEELVVLTKNREKGFRGALSKRLELARDFYHYYKKKCLPIESENPLFCGFVKTLVIICLYDENENPSELFNKAVEEGFRRRRADLYQLMQEEESILGSRYFQTEYFITSMKALEMDYDKD